MFDSQKEITLDDGDPHYIVEDRFDPQIEEWLLEPID